MRIIFTPAEGERREYDFDPDSTLMSTESGVIEKLTGWDYRGEFQQRLPASTTAQRALLYVLEKRTHPTLMFKDFDYPAGAVVIEPSQSDIDRAREQLLSGKVALPQEQIAEYLEQLDAIEADGETVPKSPAADSSDAGPAI